MIAIDEGVIGYQKTINLNKNNFQVFFFSEKEKKITFLTSETSLPTKGLKKYEKNFKLITEAECKKFDLHDLDQLKLETKNLKEHISFDRKYNYFKGFIYGQPRGLSAQNQKQKLK